MSFQKRVPPIRLLISKDEFNKMLELLSSEETSDNKSLDKIKEKVLKYSTLRNDDNNDVKVDIRFYPNEAENLLFLFVKNLKEISITKNYFDNLKNSN